MDWFPEINQSCHKWHWLFRTECLYYISRLPPWPCWSWRQYRFCRFPPFVFDIGARQFHASSIFEPRRPLAFSSGIIFLGAVSALLLIVFKGDVDSLIHLYAVGRFPGIQHVGHRDGSALVEKHAARAGKPAL